MSSKYAAKAPEQATSRSEFAKAFKNRRQNRFFIHRFRFSIDRQNHDRFFRLPEKAKFMTFSATPKPSESSPDRLRPGKAVASIWIFHQKW